MTDQSATTPYGPHWARWANQTETVFPGTDLRMIFEIGKMKIPEKSSAGSDIGGIAKSYTSGCLILENPFWPLTNNEAERTLRHWVILRQISHGTRTPEGSRYFALLASVIDTCRCRGHSPRPYLQDAITRRRQGLALLPLPV